MPASSFDQLAINLSYGDQRAVEIAARWPRAQAAPARRAHAGHEPERVRPAHRLMRKLRDERDLSILLIEHDMKVVMGVSEYVTVLDHGTKIAEGDPAPSARTPPSSRPTSESRLAHGAPRSR
jgi:branched-chain amino acid transport system ATP-binding protein